MDINEELKPCPFCGGKAVTSTYYIECESCDVAPNIDWHHMDKDKAIKAWNTRAQENPLPNKRVLSYEERQEYECKVCGNVPEEDGYLEHGKGCYTQSEDGGGGSYVDFEDGAQEKDDG